jgi:zinc and cadmium transporter
LLLAIYCAVCVVFSLSGGWVPLIVQLTHRRMQVAISFVSGVVLGIGLLHLVPHSFALLRSIDRTVLWVLLGFLFMFFLERFFHFHHHEAIEGPTSPVELTPQAGPGAGSRLKTEIGKGDSPILLPGHRKIGTVPGGFETAYGDDRHRHADRQAAAASPFSWSGAAVGLTLHGLVDGLAIAAAVSAEDANGLVTFAGIGTALAVALHKPFDALTIGTLMAAAGRPPAWRHLLNAIYSFVTPLGVVSFYLVSGWLAEPFSGLGQVLAFAGGAFICIASSDLLPELQFHRHDRAKLSLALLAGIALAWSTVFLEAAGHDHGNPPAESHEEKHGHH